MAMGTRKNRERQEPLWYGSELPEAPGHPFYKRLNDVLERAQFDGFCEEQCRPFYHEKLGRPSLPPGMYFRLMMIGFFEGIDSERGIAWRVADSLTLREFVQIGIDERTPDHVTISRTRRLIDETTHQQVFGWVLQQLARGGLIKGKTIGIDSTTLEANAAMKSCVAIRERAIPAICNVWRRPRAWMRKTLRRCGAWTGSGGRRWPTRNGSIRTTRKPRSRA